MIVTTQPHTQVLQRTIETDIITSFGGFSNGKRLARAWTQMSNHARTGEALLDMLQRTLYEFEDGDV
jgi:hypothetical protein